VGPLIVETPPDRDLCFAEIEEFFVMKFYSSLS
jgi:hypothetical protein